MGEPEIRRIMVPDQPGQKSLQDPISMGKNLVMVAAPVIPETEGSVKQEDHNTGPPGQKASPYLKNNQNIKN
jgi:hypothetical protein